MPTIKVMCMKLAATNAAHLAREIVACKDRFAPVRQAEQFALFNSVFFG
jgi:hypothetical protein